jgi:hypothetical protein
MEEGRAMTAQAQDILYAFDRLPEDDKREVVAELLRRSATIETPPLTDAAEELFLQLDREEAGNA